MADATPPGSEPEPGVGTRIGVYELVRRIGDGAMGVVFEGRHTVLSRRVAIKLLRGELAQNPDVVARFLQEARAANLASHDNIVSVTDTGQTPGGTFYLVMEYLEGSTMADVLARRRLEIPEVVRIFHQVLAALGAAHSAGLVHRDLKPGNVFLVARPEDPLFVKLLDFGVAKLRGVGLTATGMVIGTPQYMAPEQIMGRPVDARTDIFAAGVMLYEAVTGEPPFRGATLAELAAKIVHEPHVPARAKVPHLPPYLERMIDRALAKDPGARWPDVHTMRAELPRLTAAQFSAVPEPPPPAVRPGRRLAPAIIVVAVLAVVAGVLVAAVGTKGGPAPATPEVAPDARAHAEAMLRDALDSPDAAEAGDAVAALAMAGTTRTGHLLYPTLAGPPELRRQAAKILADMKLPEAAPRIRTAFEVSGDRLRVELAADLLALGDRDAIPTLRRALDEPSGRLQAALALAIAGDTSGKPVLDDLFANSPRGKNEWRGAAEGLLAGNDAAARTALTEELAANPARGVAAAAILARHGDSGGRDYLRRVVADKDFIRRGEAAVALAATGDGAARAYIPVGLASKDPEERRAAVAVAALVGGAAVADLVRVEVDPDRRTRLVAAAAVAGGSP